MKKEKNQKNGGKTPKADPTPADVKTLHVEDVKQDNNNCKD